MVLFIFPKSFEFFKFFKYILTDGRYMLYSSNYVSVGVFEMIVFVRDDPSDIIHCHYGSFIRFKVLIVDDSDIEFAKKLRPMLTSFLDEEICLVGSCGSGVEADVGGIFVVDKAIKGDRGTTNEDGVFTWRKDKTSYALARFDTKSLQQARLYDPNCTKLNKLHRRIISLNFLNETTLHPKFNNDLFDMETYDFYVLCAELGVRNFYSVRFVTDWLASMRDEGSMKISVGMYIDLLKKKKGGTFPDISFFSDRSLFDVKKYVRMKAYYRFRSLMELRHNNECVPQPNLVEIRHNILVIEKTFKNFRNDYENKLAEKWPIDLSQTRRGDIEHLPNDPSWRQTMLSFWSSLWGLKIPRYSFEGVRKVQQKKEAKQNVRFFDERPRNNKLLPLKTHLQQEEVEVSKHKGSSSSSDEIPTFQYKREDLGQGSLQEPLPVGTKPLPNPNNSGSKKRAIFEQENERRNKEQEVTHLDTQKDFST